MKQKILLPVMGWLLLGAWVSAQAPANPTSLTQNIDMTIDHLGDANMKLSMKMDASQWHSFINSDYAKNKSLFRRDLEREMMWVLFEDIDMALDDKSRVATATMNLKSVASYSGNNHWTLRLGMKDPNISKLSDNSYLITSNIMSDAGGIIQQLQKYVFPPDAVNIRPDNDRYGNAVILYELDTHEGFGVPAEAIVGVVLMLLGGLWIVWLLVGKKKMEKKNVPAG